MNKKGVSKIFYISAIFGILIFFFIIFIIFKLFFSSVENLTNQTNNTINNRTNQNNTRNWNNNETGGINGTDSSSGGGEDNGGGGNGASDGGGGGGGNNNNSNNNQTAQCNDNIDNDNDAAIDSVDFSCIVGGRYEDQYSSQCQNHRDDDFDGNYDWNGGPNGEPQDLDCENSQDNDEGTGNPTESSNIIVWYHNHDSDTNDFQDINDSGFVTHVLIDNFDYNAEPLSSVTNKIQAIRNMGLVPIWSRRLWLQAGSASQNVPQIFAQGYADGSVIYDPDYYEWFLNNLFNEASLYGVDYVAIDMKATFQIKEMIESDNATSQQEISQAIQIALSRGARRANYVYPVDMYTVQNNGYIGLAGLGENKITDNTFPECIERLEWSSTRDFDLIGIWGTSVSNCYRQNSECFLPNNQDSELTNDCPYTDQPLWSIQSIFDNINYWRNANPPRGLFIFTSTQSGDTRAFAQQLRNYCNTNQC